MRITRINIEQYGPWQNLDLAIDPIGMTVLYGPNESGKSALRDFLRGIVFGFSEIAPQQPATGGHHHVPPSPRRGFLEVVHESRCLEIHRAAQQHGPGLVRLVDHQQSEAPEADKQLLATLRGDIDGTLFDQVFSLDFHGLSFAARLDHDQLADHLFGLSLGPDGQALQSLLVTLDDPRSGPADASTWTPQLAELQDQHVRLTRDLARQAEQRPDYLGQQVDRNGLQQQVESLQQQLDAARRSLRGYQVLKQAWPTWKLAQELEAELAELPRLAGFPENGVEQLEAFEEQLSKLSDCRDAVLAEVRQLEIESQRLQLSTDESRSLARARQLLESREQLLQFDRRHDHTCSRVRQLEASLKQKLASLGDDWTRDRLASLDTSPATALALSRTGQAFDNSLASLHRIEHTIERISTSSQRDLARIDRELQALDASPLESALVDTRGLLRQLQQRGTMELRSAELHQRHDSLSNELRRATVDQGLPRSIRWGMAGFAISGLVMAVAGFATGLFFNGLAGTAFTLLGCFCLGTSWCINRHFRDQRTERLDELCQLVDENESRLIEADAGRERVRRIPVGTTAEALRETTRRLARLEQLDSDRARCQQQRQRLTKLRDRARRRLHLSEAARRAWQDQLGECGLPLCDDVEQALTDWTAAAETDCLLEDLEAAEQERDHIDGERAERLAQIEATAACLPPSTAGLPETASPLLQLEQVVREAEERDEESRRLSQQKQDRQFEATEFLGRSQQLQARQAALMVQAGATSTEEFRDRARSAKRHQELLAELAVTREALAAASGSGRDLAIDPRLLGRFDSEANERVIRSTSQQCEELLDRLETARHQLETVLGSLARAESDRSCQRLLREREAVRQQLRTEFESLLARQLLADLANNIRAEYEWQRQPESLTIASGFLDRLTTGRFPRTWCPLGSRTLVVDDQHGQTHSLDFLSSSTRDQLFLSVRLALVTQLAEDGLELPLVLDDILAACDEERSRAAVELLQDFAGETRQVLFLTRDRELADRCEHLGSRVISLPACAGLRRRRRAG